MADLRIGAQEATRISCKSRKGKGLVAFSSSLKVLECIKPPKILCSRGGLTSQVLCFLIKVAVLEAVRRISKAKSPFIWRAVQTLQIICYPPFKWIQRWGPLQLLVNGILKISRPLLFLSVTTELYDHYEDYVKKFDEDHRSRSPSEIPSGKSTSSEQASTSSTPDTINLVESTEAASSRKLLAELQLELEKHGIILPQRINEDELRRFCIAANGEFPRLLSSIRKTIRWRETYHILSQQELELWSHLVFWHGFDMARHPCLIVRLGLAVSRVIPLDRPRFAQAVVSQLEFGVLHLVDKEDGRITVLLDCEGLSPLRFPMQMLRSSSSVVQENFPNRLASLYIIRLPPLVRVLAHTFIQVVKPRTREKLHFHGEGYMKVISELLDRVPKFLGGSCSCSACEKLSPRDSAPYTTDEDEALPPHDGVSRSDSGSDNDQISLLDTRHIAESGSNSCEHVLRSAVLALLLIWIFIAFLSGMNDVGFPPPPGTPVPAEAL